MLTLLLLDEELETLKVSMICYRTSCVSAEASSQKPRLPTAFPEPCSRLPRRLQRLFWKLYKKEFLQLYFRKNVFPEIHFWHSIPQTLRLRDAFLFFTCSLSVEGLRLLAKPFPDLSAASRFPLCWGLYLSLPNRGCSRLPALRGLCLFALRPCWPCRSWQTSAQRVISTCTGLSISGPLFYLLNIPWT